MFLDPFVMLHPLEDVNPLFHHYDSNGMNQVRGWWLYDQYLIVSYLN